MNDVYIDTFLPKRVSILYGSRFNDVNAFANLSTHMPQTQSAYMMPLFFPNTR
jgi:hypothetical protein